MKWIPNGLTISRLIGAPIIMGLMLAGHQKLAFYCFVVFAITDALDGWAARLLNSFSSLVWLDTIADGALVTCAALGFTFSRENAVQWVVIYGGVLMAATVMYAIRVHTSDSVLRARVGATQMVAYYATVFFSLYFYGHSVYPERGLELAAIDVLCAIVFGITKLHRPMSRVEGRT